MIKEKKGKKRDVEEKITHEGRIRGVRRDRNAELEMRKK